MYQKLPKLHDFMQSFSVNCFYSTSLPSGNLVDGLPLVLHAVAVWLLSGSAQKRDRASEKSLIKLDNGK